MYAMSVEMWVVTNWDTLLIGWFGSGEKRGIKIFRVSHQPNNVT